LHPSTAIAEISVPGVSVIKPLTAVDDFAIAGLHAMLAQDYPKVRVANFDSLKCTVRFVWFTKLDLHPVRFHCMVISSCLRLCKQFELLLCLSGSHPSDVKTLKDFAQEHPDVRVYHGSSQIGVNPKINNICEQIVYCLTKIDIITIFMCYPTEITVVILGLIVAL
jgi:hypothetical protein